MPKFRVDYLIRKSVTVEAEDIAAAASRSFSAAMNREGAAAKLKILQVLAEGEMFALPDDAARSYSNDVNAR